MRECWHGGTRARAQCRHHRRPRKKRWCLQRGHRAPGPARIADRSAGHARVRSRSSSAWRPHRTRCSVCDWGHRHVDGALLVCRREVSHVVPRRIWPAVAVVSAVWSVGTLPVAAQTNAVNGEDRVHRVRLQRRRAAMRYLGDEPGWNGTDESHQHAGSD